MNRICENQNKKENLDLLIAQRILHSEEKVIFNMRGIVAILFMIFGFFQIENSEAKSLIALFSVLYIFIDVLILEKIEESIREKAAGIQELFDTKVLLQEWNQVLIPKKPDYERVNSAVAKFKAKKKDISKLVDWYSTSVSRVDIKTGRPLCQRSNIVWSSNLRRSLSHWLIAFLCLLLVGAVILAICKQLSVSDLIVFMFLPIAPMVSLLLKKIISYRKTAKDLDGLKEYADQLITDSVSLSDDEAMNRSRLLQNEIYRYRSTSIPIPDWYYFLFKNKYESDMRYNVEAKLRDLGL